MLDSFNQWLADPAVQKLVVSLIGLLIIGLVVQLLHRSVTHRIQQTDTRHRVRKVINFSGYLAAFLLIAFVVAEEKGHLSIAIGVATAAVAFSLQEVIASVAGWVEQCIKMTGANQAAVEHSSCRAQGDDRCLFELRWR